MKRLIYFIAIAIYAISTTAQVGIGTTTPEAQLDIRSTNQATPANTDGILIPKIDNFPAINPTAAKDGMLVYATGNGAPSKGFYYWNNILTNWVAFSGADDGDWVVVGGNIERQSGNVYVGDTSGTNNDLYISNRLIDWDNSSYFVDPAAENRLNEVSFDPGSLTDVSIRFGEQNTGFYSSGSNEFSLATNGIQRFYADAIGFISFGDSNATTNYVFPSTRGLLNQVLLSDGSGNLNWTDAASIGDEDHDWYEVGTTAAPDDINDDMFTQGNVAIGKTTADYLLDISTTTETRGINTLVNGSTSGLIFGSYIENSNTGNGSHYGSYNFLDGAGTGVQTGAANVVSNTGNGLHYGIFNLINNSGTGNHYAAYNEIAGGNAATGSQYGSYQSINNSATNNQYASYNRIWGNGDGNHYGAYQTIENNGDGEHYGAFNNLIGSGTGTQYGTYQNIYNFGTGWHIGVRNDITGTTATGDTDGVFNNITRGGSGSVTGVRNDITNATSTGVKTGVATIITGSGGTKSGITNSVSGTTTATQAGVRNTISTSSNNIQYGVNNQVSALTGNNSNTFGTFNVVEGEGNGAHYGTYSSLSGTGTGEQYGSYNEILNNGNNDHFGTYNELRGSGMGDHYGSGTYITGAGTGNQFGVRNEIINSGDGMHYGTYSNLTGTGTGNKYGIYTSINTAAGGDHYGVYSEVLKVGSYAGYYLGDVSIGTTIANNYILPSSRGAANQIMKTDGLGNVGWTSPALGDLSTVTASNGLYYDSATSRIKLGGMLTENTDISQNNFNMTFILDGASDIVVQNSINTPLFQVESTGESYFANNSLWRVGNAITGTIFAQISDNSDDGRFILYENGVASIDLDANSQFIFNEQGLDRNFRIESDSNSDMFFVDAGLNRVGIGTATPVDRFEVNGGRVEFTAITDASGTTGTGVLEIADALRIDGNEIITNTDTRLHLQHDNNGDFSVDNTTLFVDANLNRVGIGTATPAYQLQLTTNSAAKPTSNVWTVASDSRLKNNIRPFTDGLELIKQINPIWFTYNGKAGMPIETGVGTLAQEFQKIAPYMVKAWQYTSEDGSTSESYLGIDYGPLNFVMVNAIQEQQDIIEIQKSKIESLEEQNKHLEERLSKLESQETDIKSLLARMQKLENSTGIN